MFLERRELKPPTPRETGQPGKGGKGAKKGKKSGGKGAAPEQPPPPPEAPWRCRAIVDLSPLVKVDDSCDGGGGSGGSRNSALPKGRKSGASPLRIELKAPLALLPPEKDGDAATAGAEVDAATATAAAAESVAVRTSLSYAHKREKEGERREEKWFAVIQGGKCMCFIPHALLCVPVQYTCFFLLDVCQQTCRASLVFGKFSHLKWTRMGVAGIEWVATIIPWKPG